MKIAVYTIALNEAANVERWASSAADADYRVVADTGSSDDTVERLERAGVTVHRILVRPWRFDDARNAALALLPADADICLSMDMDEFLEPGWRAKVEAAWTPGTTALYCQLAARSSLDDSAPRIWPAKKFHARRSYRFQRPVHEELRCAAGPETARDSDVLIHHIQDWNKGTRSQYLPLLEIAHKEDPADSQICFWLGRDSMFANRNERAITVLQRYLALPASTWGEERAEAMRCLALMEPDKRMAWLDKARTEAPHRREVWLDLAREFHLRADWLNLFWACTHGIERTRRTGSYLDDPASWGAELFDLGAIACCQLGVLDRAIEWERNATQLSPDDRRLADNLRYFIRRQASARAGVAIVPADAPRTRLFTSSGTVLYVDETSGQLRHGAPPGSPANAVFISDPMPFEGCWTGRLMQNTITGLQPIACTADGCWSLAQANTVIAGATPTIVQLIPLKQGVVGIQSGGRYLCAEPDGRVSLSRAKCSLWEFFVPSDDWCATPPDATKHAVNGTGSAIDWSEVRSFIATSSVVRGSGALATP